MKHFALRRDDLSLNFPGPYGQKHYRKCLKEYDQADSLLLEISDNQKSCILPLFSKQSYGVAELYTPYGYGAVAEDIKFDNFEIENLRLFLREKNIIRLFLRSNLDGLLGIQNDQASLLNNIYKIKLSDPYNTSTKFTKKVRYERRKCERYGIIYKIQKLGAVTDSLITECYDIYERLMITKSATYLRFNKKLFRCLMSNKLQGDLLTLYYNGDLLFFAIFLRDGFEASYHLSAGKTVDQLNLASFGLQVMSDYYKALGLQFLHLGGGNRKGDGLDLFKSKHSNMDTRFKIYNLISDKTFDADLRNQYSITKRRMLWEQKFLCSE